MFSKIKNFLNSNTLDGFSTINELGQLEEKIIELDKFSNLDNFSQVDIVISDNIDKPLLKADKIFIENIEISLEKDSLIVKNNKKFNLKHTTNKPTLFIPLQTLKNINNYGVGNINAQEVQESIVSHSIGNIHVTMFTGRDIQLKSLGDIVIDTVKSKELTVSSNGIGDIKIKEGEAHTLDAQLSSTGNMTILISSQIVEAENQGVGNLILGEVSKQAHLDLYSTGDMTMSGSCSQQLIINNSGIGQVRAPELNSAAAVITLYSMGDIQVAGDVDYLCAISQGVGIINGTDLKVIKSDINLNSLGDIKFQPISETRIEHNGVGTINLQGSAVLDLAEIDMTSLGDVRANNITARVLTIDNIGQGGCSMQKASKGFRP